MSEWDQRQLCPDGACVGVIGSDGTCKVCGRAAPNWGDERKRGLVADAANTDDEDEYEDDDEEYEDDEEEVVAGPADPDWEQRKLCPDEACIGVIGDDGKCKVCHRSAA
jgi:hypothetical protein